MLLHDIHTKAAGIAGVSQFDGFPVDIDVPFVGREIARQYGHKRGFTRPVLTKNGVYLAGIKGYVDVIQSRNGAEPLG
jgi:hypothetical protein